MNGIESHGPKSKTWVHDVGSDLSKSFSTEVDGLVILAECSRLKHLSWQLPSELRCQTLAPVSSGRSFSGTEPNEIFGSVVRLTEKEYEFARDSQYLDALVLRNRDFGFESPGGEWCALSPILGRACGWHRGPGVFLWLDADDNVMVYSLWWVDGLIDYGAPHWTETGEGWLVLATQDALQRIESVAGGLVRLVAMERRFMGKEDTDDSENLPTHKEAFASFPYVKQ